MGTTGRVSAADLSSLPLFLVLGLALIESLTLFTLVIVFAKM